MPTSSSKKIKTKKSSTLLQNQDSIDPRQEQIDRLIREREEIRSKLNLISSKILENSRQDHQWNKCQPSEIPSENILMMIDEICYYRSAFLELFQESDDETNQPVKIKVTQLARDEPELIRKRLTADQRLTFVIRERDLWKENALSLQLMYASIVDQLEMGLFKRFNRTPQEILHSHRLNLEEVCRIFSSPRLKRIGDEDKTSQIVHSKPIVELPTVKKETAVVSVDKRRVSFAEQVNVIEESPRSFSASSLSSTTRLPSARETLIDQMEPNLRMNIVKELSKDAHGPIRPPSQRSFMYNRQVTNYSIPSEQKRSFEWVELARLIGIHESDIEHWLSQTLQYPAGRVLSSWCRSSSPSPTVADLHRLMLSHELHRHDLANQIEQIYSF